MSEDLDLGESDIATVRESISALTAPGRRVEKLETHYLSRLTSAERHPEFLLVAGGASDGKSGVARVGHGSDTAGLLGESRDVLEKYDAYIGQILAFGCLEAVVENDLSNVVASIRQRHLEPGHRISAGTADRVSFVPGEAVPIEDRRGGKTWRLARHSRDGPIDSRQVRASKPVWNGIGHTIPKDEDFSDVDIATAIRAQATAQLGPLADDFQSHDFPFDADIWNLYTVAAREEHALIGDVGAGATLESQGDRFGQNRDLEVRQEPLTAIVSVVDDDLVNLGRLHQMQLDPGRLAVRQRPGASSQVSREGVAVVDTKGLCVFSLTFHVDDPRELLAGFRRWVQGPFAADHDLSEVDDTAQEIVGVEESATGSTARLSQDLQANHAPLHTTEVDLL